MFGRMGFFAKDDRLEVRVEGELVAYLRHSDSEVVMLDVDDKTVSMAAALLFAANRGFSARLVDSFDGDE